MTTPSVPNIRDLVILQGSRFQFVIHVSVEWLATLTGYSARGQVRADRSATSALYADLSSALTVDVANSQVVLDIAADASTAWDFDVGQYDIEVFVAGDPTKTVRIMQGKATLNREVSR
jgi:hypothetical protein